MLNNKYILSVFLEKIIIKTVTKKLNNLYTKMKLIIYTRCLNRNSIPVSTVLNRNKLYRIVVICSHI